MRIVLLLSPSRKSDGISALRERSLAQTEMVWNMPIGNLKRPKRGFKVEIRSSRFDVKDAIADRLGQRRSGHSISGNRAGLAF